MLQQSVQYDVTAFALLKLNKLLTMRAMMNEIAMVYT